MIQIRQSTRDVTCHFLRVMSLRLHKIIQKEDLETKVLNDSPGARRRITGHIYDAERCVLVN